MSELKLCPFCGATVHRVVGFRGLNFFKCSKCGAVVSFDNDFYNTHKNEAINAYNSRTDSENDRLQQKNERLKELLRLAMRDVPYLCVTCKNFGLNPDGEKFCPLMNITDPQWGGTAKWSKCIWQWQHTDKLKELGIEI